MPHLISRSRRAAGFHRQQAFTRTWSGIGRGESSPVLCLPNRRHGVSALRASGQINMREGDRTPAAKASLGQLTLLRE
jgi:hypothetical protein